MDVLASETRASSMYKVDISSVSDSTPGETAEQSTSTTNIIASAPPAEPDDAAGSVGGMAASEQGGSPSPEFDLAPANLDGFEDVESMVTTPSISLVDRRLGPQDGRSLSNNDDQMAAQ